MQALSLIIGIAIGIACSLLLGFWFYGPRQKKQHQLELTRSQEQLEAAKRQIMDDHVRMIKQEKLAGLGQLAAGVAHEINNPLGFVQANSEMIQGYVDSFKCILQMYQDNLDTEQINHKRQELDLDYLLQDIDSLLADNIEGISRVAEIVANLKAFSRIDKPSTDQIVDVEQCIKSTLTVARNEIKYDAQVHTDFANIPNIQGNGGELNQVFLNIIVNAAQAIRSMKKTTPGNIWIQTKSNPHSIQCIIQDDGPGIPATDLDKIFDPFFTTKPVGEGTGLGLNICYDIIVNNHKGHLDVQSQEGSGTTFTITLPANQAENS
jgi:signal transduction histidine kinase